MKKTIRPTYPVEVSVGILVLVFVLSFFLSTQIFTVPWREIMEGTPVYLGMFLISVAVIIVALILWEEFLFPLKIRPGKDGGVVFRNHRTKLNVQMLMYLVIPAIFTFVYFKFEINTTRFFIWAAICTLTPVVSKLISGVKNYNDFLKLNDHAIEYKNNKKSSVFLVSNIRRLTLVRDEGGVLHKIKVSTAQGDETIDLDEMELDAFVEAIGQYITTHYQKLIG